MSEKSIATFLVATGVVSLLVIIFSSLQITSIVVGIFNEMGPFMMPLLLCQQTNQSEYILSLPTSLESCDKLLDYEDLRGADCSLFYKDDLEARNACNELLRISEKRVNDCIDIFALEVKTSVSEGEVEAHCKVLESRLISSSTSHPT